VGPQIGGQGELLGLRWQDIDWTFGRLSVRRTLVRIGKQMLFNEPRSRRSRRTIALPPVLMEELKTVRNGQKEYRRVLGSAYADYDLVFCQPNGKPLHAHNLSQRDFQSVAARAGVPHIRFHDLRHCSATLLLREGVHPKVVQERLGHSGISITMDTYSHVLPGMQEQAASRLADRLMGRDAGICKPFANEGNQE
jgi:integrase